MPVPRTTFHWKRGGPGRSRSQCTSGEFLSSNIAQGARVHDVETKSVDERGDLGLGLGIVACDDQGPSVFRADRKAVRGQLGGIDVVECLNLSAAKTLYEVTGVLSSGGIRFVQMFLGLRLAASETLSNGERDLTLYPTLLSTWGRDGRCGRRRWHYPRRSGGGGRRGVGRGRRHGPIVDDATCLHRGLPVARRVRDRGYQDSVAASGRRVRSQAREQRRNLVVAEARVDLVEADVRMCGGRRRYCQDLHVLDPVGHEPMRGLKQRRVLD